MLASTLWILGGSLRAMQRRPRGYTQYSDLANSRRLLTQAAQESMNQQMAVVRGGDQTVTPSQVVATEIAESSIHANTRGNLAELAEATGGALLPDSLDLRQPLRRAMEDLRTHYELSYSPSNLQTDGSFRKIEVKVAPRRHCVCAQWILCVAAAEWPPDLSFRNGDA